MRAPLQPTDNARGVPLPRSYRAIGEEPLGRRQRAKGRRTEPGTRNCFGELEANILSSSGFPMSESWERSPRDTAGEILPVPPLIKEGT